MLAEAGGHDTSNNVSTASGDGRASESERL